MVYSLLEMVWNCDSVKQRSHFPGDMTEPRDGVVVRFWRDLPIPHIASGLLLCPEKASLRRTGHHGPCGFWYLFPIQCGCLCWTTLLWTLPLGLWNMLYLCDSGGLVSVADERYNIQSWGPCYWKGLLVPRTYIMRCIRGHGLKLGRWVSGAARSPWASCLSVPLSVKLGGWIRWSLQPSQD